jgi:hypothetical protein
MHAKVIRCLVEAEEALDKAAQEAAGRDKTMWDAMVEARNLVRDMTGQVMRLGATAYKDVYGEDGEFSVDPRG